MCQVCHSSPCRAGCPNAPDPPEVFTCKYCGEPIVPGDEYLEVDGDHYHLEDCASDAALTILLEKFGARRGVAEVDDLGFDTMPEFPELTFDEGPHIYRLNGLETPSVTTLMAPLSAAVYGGVDESIMERAAGRGTAVHNAIENWVAYGIEDIAPEYRGYFAGFLAWQNERKPVVLGTECRLYHKVLRYAGTADLPCIVDGKRTMVDVKTTAQLQEMLARVQLEAYSRAYESHGVSFEAKAILHLRRDGTYKFEPYPLKDPEAWTTFGALLTVNSYIQKFRK